MANASEKFQSKVAPIPRSVSGNVAGLHGIFQKLMEEHGEMTALLLRVSSSSDESVCMELYPTLRRELLAHETGEAAAIDPFLAEYSEIAELVFEHGRKAAELKSAITALDVLDYDDARWKLGFEHLAMLVRQHVEQEESEFFPRAQAAIGENNAKMLEVRYQESKSAIV